MNFVIDLQTIENRLDSLKSELDQKNGQLSLLAEQISNQKIKLEGLNNKKILYTKSAELVNLVQLVTKQKMKESFERLVTYALRFIYSENYNFELEFGRRGNLSEINFNVKTPDFQGASDPLDTSGGGVLDILSLALRICLIELSHPKVEGFLVLDEPFKHLSQGYLEKAEKFLEAINKKIGRQIILVTHQSDLVDSAVNKIEVK